MKKTFTIAVIACLSLVSCKKDRTCECTKTVVSRTSTQPNYTYTAQAPTNSSTVYTKINKKNVFAQACVKQEMTQTSNQSVYTGSVVANYVVTEVSQNDCELK